MNADIKQTSLFDFGLFDEFDFGLYEDGKYTASERVLKDYRQKEINCFRKMAKDKSKRLFYINENRFMIKSRDDDWQDYVIVYLSASDAVDFYYTSFRHKEIEDWIKSLGDWAGYFTWLSLSCAGVPPMLNAEREAALSNYAQYYALREELDRREKENESMSK